MPNILTVLPEISERMAEQGSDREFRGQSSKFDEGRSVEVGSKPQVPVI